MLPLVRVRPDSTPRGPLSSCSVSDPIQPQHTEPGACEHRCSHM
ncbi:Hypothetical protein CAP_7380 [Chondromyces apiculatus DSM 436]|uniref:Uncharacterized protein n=1 Tax=Chondromyces apiculatus DSM 436 TaxID=1192034 RepID=A0A017SYW2_9BACT|nr:Hypothetical protein CAP_7380 [Chondromyces apiculatus DSM 436]